MLFAIILVTAAISIMAFGNEYLFSKLKFNAYFIRRDREWYRFFSYALVHADWGHLLINMFVLYSFGDIVLQFFNADFGPLAGLKFMLLYVGGVLFSTIFDYVKNKDNIYYNAVGASGAVSAVLFSSIILYPTGKIFFFFIPIGIPSWIFGILYLVYSAYMGKRGADNIGHFAHFWGAVFGIVFTMFINHDYLVRFYLQLGFSF